MSEITKRVDLVSKSSKAIAEEMYRDGICFGGLRNDLVSHHQLLQLFLEDISRIDILGLRDGNYNLRPISERKRKAGEAVVGLISEIRLHPKARLDKLLSCSKAAFFLDTLSIESLIELAKNSRQIRTARLIPRHLSRADISVERIIVHEEIYDAVQNRDELKIAALANLEAEFASNERDKEKLCARALISLAVFCKRAQLMTMARELYLKASQMLEKYPEDSASAKRQRVNYLECERYIKLREGDYHNAIRCCSEQKMIWEELGQKKQVIFCRCMELEIQSQAAEDMDNYLKATNLILQCSNFASALSDRRQIGYLAKSRELVARNFWSVGNYAEASSCFEEAAKYCQKIKDTIRVDRFLGAAHQTRALHYKENLSHSYGEIASEFSIAKEKFDLAGSEGAARVCESDYHKYAGLECKNKGECPKAISHFETGRSIMVQLSRFLPHKADQYLIGAKWFEGIMLETEAHKIMSSLIQKRDNLTEPMKLLQRSGDLFAELMPQKNAEIAYCLASILMAISEFHAGRIPEANKIVSGVKQRLPAGFGFALLEDPIDDRWQPLRYTMNMIEEFNRYSRRIETEKGFSFESRIRELLKREYSTYDHVESKSYTPNEDEIGVVFPDKSQIEVDAIGRRIDQRRMLILLAEIRNRTEPVDTNDVALFERKMKFIKRRYSKICALESLKSAEIEAGIFVSRSGFTDGSFERMRARSANLASPSIAC